MRIVNSADRRPKENPGVSLKRTTWSILLNRQPKIHRVRSEVMRSVSSSRLPSLLFLPTSYSLCVLALQALSCPGEGEGKGRLVLL